MKIHQNYTHSPLRNFSYFIELDDKSVYIIDPWDSKQIISFVEENKLKPKAIINTHEHWDHTQGNQELVNTYNCEVWAHVDGKGKIPSQSRYLKPNELIDLDRNTSIEVINTPGHSEAHLCFLVLVNKQAYCLFSGDILFNAGVGNCHNGGNVVDLFDTISTKISPLQDTIIVYPGHDYLENNLNFTLDREPSNTYAVTWLKKYLSCDLTKKPLVTTLGDERKINTFFRLEKSEIRANLPNKPNNNKDTFIALRSLRNKW